MKTKFFVVALLVALVGFGACGKKKEKSPVNTIKSFIVNGKEYVVGTSDIAYIYPKVPAGGAWVDLPTGKVTPEITLTDKKATVTDQNIELDFSTLGANEGVHTMRTYTVNAENGETKTYTVKVTKGGLPN